MKLKPNLNVESRKRFLIQHGEKAAFGLAVCVLLLFFWKTLKLEVLERGQGTRSAHRAGRENEATRPRLRFGIRKAQNIEIVDYPARAEHVPLNVSDYDLTVYLDKPLWDSTRNGRSPRCCRSKNW